MSTSDRLFECFPPRPGRTHEVTGAGAATFACAVAGKIGGSVLWIKEAWRSEALNPWAVSDFFNPSQMLCANVKDQTDALAVAEEALRSGAVRLVVYELAKPFGLTAGRRLQLAAQAGNATGLGILSEGLGSNATETRWHCQPIFHASDSTLHKWEIKKNKKGTYGVWHVRWVASSRSIVVVPTVGHRPCSEGVPN